MNLINVVTAEPPVARAAVLGLSASKKAVAVAISAPTLSSANMAGKHAVAFARSSLDAQCRQQFLA